MYGIGLLCRVVSICSLRNYSSGSTKKLLEFLAAMPKANSARIAEAQRQRQQISKKSEKYGPSTVYLQVLGSGARGAPNTLYLFTDQKRYLFNCGECTQRLAHEHKVKLSKLDHIFITNKTWRNIGGLPGLSLTLQDVGVPNITLHGPEGLDELYQATRRFVIMKDMNVTMAKCSPNEDFEDNVMTVKYVLLGPLDNLLTDKDLKPVSKKPKLDSADKEFEEFIHDDTDYYRPEIRNMEAKMKPNIISKEKPKQKSSIMDPMKKKTEKFLHELQKMTNASVAYICTLKKRLGTLDLAKCVERGVKPGPLLGQLKSGQDVVLPDGTLVLSKDVKTPDDPGPVFIVLDMPDISYLKEDEFAAHFDNETNPAENIPTLCVHFTPPHVMEHPRYRQFMSKFGETTRHLVLNSQNSCLGSEAVHRSQQKLHLLDADVFPLLRDMSVPAVWSATPPQTNVDSPGKLKGLEELKNKIALAQFQNIISLEGAGSCKGDGLDGENESMPKLDIIAARTLTMFHLRPKKQLDRSVEPKLHIQDYIQETMDVDGFVTSLDQFRQLVDSLRYVRSQATREFPKLVFLGTGSCIPSKTRNTSAIALQVDENRSMLMDCGEGTFGQLVRFYGPKKVNAFLRTLKAIYISHLHADHHIGLIGVLQARRQAFEEISEEHEPLYLLAPGQIVTWLTLYDQQFERIKNEFTLIPNQSLLQGAPNQNELLSPAILAGLGLQQITTCLVAHCPNAFGVAIDIDPQNKVTYSGDTLPCEELVRIGENSKLLIHEATMEDELEDEARTKMHSTTSQAIDIGRKMNAKYTVLTHFSQRYARLPRLNAHILNDNKSVGIAFDNMQITMSDLELLPHMYAPLQLMFAEHCVEMELKAAQRARHKERRSSTPTLPPIAKCGDGPVEATPRWLTNACKTTTSVPNGHASYLETNASRLRQETKGMPINGIIRTAARSRSDSVSPNKTMKSTSKLEGGNETSTVKQYHTHAKSMEVPSITRRINDECNAPSYLQELPEHTPIIEAPYENVIDTRSKTLNKAPPSYRPPTCDEVLNAMEMKARIRSPVHLASASGMKPSVTDRTGYGKPLVTPMNKKLKIKRDPPSSSFNTRSDRVVSPGAIRSGSPLISPRVTRPASPAVRSSSPLSNKTHSKFAKPVESKSRGPEIKSPYAERIKQKERDSSRNLRDMNLDVKYSSTPTTNRSKTSPIRKHPPSEPIRKSQLPRPIQSNLMRDRSKHRIKSRPTSKQSLQQAKHQSNSNSKQSLGRNSPGNNSRSNSRQSLGKDLAFPPNHVCSITQNRSFRPQLEDIKSSFLILNAKKGHSKRPQINDIKVQPVSRPKLLNEDQRKQQLDEVKQKYQKYEKIEGLNWISWK